MDPVAIAANLLYGSLTDLHKVNDNLKESGYPPYFLGQSGFNVEYRLANKPRWVIRWWPPGVRLSQLYLYYMPDIPKGQEPTQEDEITVDLDH